MNLTHSQKRILKEYKYLMKEQKKYGTLQDALSLCKSNLVVVANLSIDNATVLITIRYNINPQSHLLLDKMNKYVKKIVDEYASDYIYMNLSAEYPNDFPFKPPIWKLNNYDDNMEHCPKDILMFYNYVIDQHNEMYSKQWSPAISLKADFISLLVKLMGGITYSTSNNETHLL